MTPQTPAVQLISFGINLASTTIVVGYKASKIKEKSNFKPKEIKKEHK